MTHVTFILFPEFQMLAYVLATETLRVANKCAGRDVFEWETRTATNSPVLASSRALVAPDTVDWTGSPKTDLVLLCAGYNPLDFVVPRVRAYLAQAVDQGAVIGGVDTGTVILAELGLLDGVQAVLHYEAEAAFRERWPEISVTDRIYCLDGKRLTAAGGTATGDALLSWIARDVDPDLASATADGMAHGRPRSGDTPQRTNRTADPILLQMHAIMAENMCAPLPVTEICKRLGASPKQLRRRCQKAYGLSPSTYDQSLRLEAAHHMLTSSRQPVSEIALACGFASLSGFSRAFRVAFGRPPSQIRIR